MANQNKHIVQAVNPDILKNAENRILKPQNVMAQTHRLIRIFCV